MRHDPCLLTSTRLSSTRSLPNIAWAATSQPWRAISLVLTLSIFSGYLRKKSFAGDEGNLITDLGWAPVAAGFIMATVSAALAVKWLVGYLNRHGLAVFGWYRLALSVLFVFFG